MIIAHANYSLISYDEEERTSKLEMAMVLVMEDNIIIRYVLSY